MEPVYLEIRPPLEGKCKWISQSELRFYPEEQLRPSTEYALKISPKLVEPTGKWLSCKKAFEFHTARIHVANYTHRYIPDEKRPGLAGLFVTVEFNYEIPPSDLQEKLKLRFVRGKEIDYKIDQRSPSRVLTAVCDPIPLKDMDRKIRLRIEKGIKPVDGTLPLSEDYAVTFAMPARQKLIVERAYPEASGEDNWITVQFSTPVAKEAARDFITIEPEMSFDLERNHRYLSIHGEFAPGEVYVVILKKGFLALNGSELEREFSTAVEMKELEPYLDFVTPGIFLPKRGNLNVGIESINIDTVELSIEKIFVNNLVHFLNTNRMNSRYSRRGLLGKHVSRHEIEVEGPRNVKVMTTVDMSDHLDEEREGIYILTLRRPRHRWHSTIKWVRITDLGISAKIGYDDMTVYVNSLENLNPQAGVKVKLISKTNQVLLEGLTNSEGVVRFGNYRSAREGFESFVITAEKGRDLSFAKLADCRLSMGGFEVGGDPVPREGYEAFLYTDRGVYRPGDTVRMVTIIRQADGQIPSDFPLKVQILAPDGSIFNEYRGWVGDAGADEFDVEIPLYAMTGVYTARTLIADSVEVGRRRFNVEEFMPQRIKVDIWLDKETYSAGEDVGVEVKGTMLFGPPAAERKVEAKYTISSTAFTPTGFSKFHFGDREKKFDKIETALGEGLLDAQGTKRYQFQIPDNIKPPSALSGLIEVSVYELGGRAVTEHEGFVVHPYPHYIGMRRAEEGYADKDKETSIDFVVVKPDGEKVGPRDLELSFYMVKWHSILRRDKSGYYRYVSERSLDLVERRDISYTGDVSRVALVPHRYGQYQVAIEDPQSGASSSIVFYVSGWGYAPWAMAEPDKLMIDFDKDSYRVGEQATVQIRSPFSGKLILTVERDGILDQRIIRMQENTATITLPVREEYKPNVYVVGSLIRSNRSLEIHAPVRAYGAYPLTVDCSDQRLTVDLVAPDHINPRSTLDVSVRTKGGSGRTYLTIAAVDEGILQITDFATPDPFGYYYRKRRLSVQTYDIYSLILPEIEESEKKSSPGGGRAEERAKHLMPVALRRVKPVALWSGIVRTDQQGRATVPLKVPQFQGSLRVMAVAFDGASYGSASRNVIVSDPIVLTPTFPRFIAGKDSFDIPVNVYNGTDKEGQVTVELSVDGPVEILSPTTQTVDLPSKRESLVKFTCQAADEMGGLHFRLEASGLGSATRHDVDVPLRPASPLVTEVGAGRIGDDGEESFETDPDWIKGTTRLQISLSPFALVSFGHSLRFLLRYPHGCIEQTTSRVFPLLYFSDIARVAEPSLFKDRSANYFIEEGITKLRSMQMGNGAFSYWPGRNYESEWGSIYATHFLAEAQRAGYQVPDRVTDRAARHLKRMVKQKLESRTRKYQLERQAYAAYVLALMGKPEKSSMNYIRQAELKGMSTWAQTLLAGAFALSGDVNTAMSMITFDIGPSQAPRETGANFNSSTRENAILLDVLNEIDPEHPSIPLLVEAIADRLKRHTHYTTQGSAFGFMALGKSLKASKTANYQGEVWWDDGLLASFGIGDTVIQQEGGEGKKIRIAIEGEGPCYYYWYFSGIRKGARFEEYDKGLQVSRTYMDRWGHPIDYDNITQGDIVVARITMTATADNLDNVIITDMLPAGLEIENPRLGSRNVIKWIGKKTIVPDYMDIRDDRLNVYLNLRKGKTVQFYYTLRAVTVGRFVLPPVKGEAMYDPFKSSVANSGMIRVVSGR
ncbi:MAG: alpha-2-macroglobulin family protein [Candidatus Zixiibacteriota bacterium]|nr:MAG: alpha-2-macroglobulin family protein [candidate division Zixibacteria bacterium]